MKTRIYTSIGVMSALGLLMSLPAHALGLGKLQLSSALNEPFNAEIPVTAIKGDEADGLTVRLASNLEFERAGLIKSAEINKLKFKVVKRQGKTVISVKSTDPVREPLLDFLLTAKTSSGHLIREYTVLLDPPKQVFKNTQVSPKVVPSPSISQPKRVVSSSQPVKVAPRVNPTPRPAFSGAKQYVTSRNDTLWDVALKTRPDSAVSVHQMMMALVDKNPNAFIRQNVNGLKSGYTLNIPSDNEISRLSKQQAKSAFNVQNKAWKNRNKTSNSASSKAASAVVADAPVAVSPESNESSGQAEPVSRLKLLGSDETSLEDNNMAAFGDEKVQELSDQLTVAQQVIESQQQENIDIKARMVALEAQIETLRKLVSIEDPSLAQMQSKLESDVSAEQIKLSEMAEEIKASLNEAGTDVIETVDTAVSDLVDPVVDGAAAPLDDAIETTEDQLGAAEESVAPVVETEMEVAPTPVEPEAEVSFLDKVVAFFTEYKLQALLGVVALLLSLFMIGRKRAEDERKIPWEEAVGTIPASDDYSNRVDEAVPAVVVTDVAEESEKTVEALLEESERELDQAHYANAVGLLEQAHQKSPNDLAVIQKLLLSHYKLGNATQFVEVARAYTVERDSMEWNEIATWGRVLAPTNVLFELPSAGEKIVFDDAVAESEATLERVSSDMDDELLDFNANASELETTDTVEDASSVYDEDKVEFEPVSDTTLLASESVSDNEEKATFVDDDVFEFETVSDSSSTVVDSASSELEAKENLVEDDVSEEDTVSEAILAEQAPDLSSQLEVTEELAEEEALEFEALTESAPDILASVSSLEDEGKAMSAEDEALEFEAALDEAQSAIDSDSAIDTDSVEEDLEFEAVTTEAETSLDAALSSELEEMEESTEDDVFEFEAVTDDLQADLDSDLSLDSGTLDEITEKELEAASIALSESGQDDDSLSFDLSDFDQVDEAETKLDLASAYIEMGDPTGAKSILEEILTEGNDEQQARAKSLLNDLP